MLKYEQDQNLDYLMQLKDEGLRMRGTQTWLKEEWLKKRTWTWLGRGWTKKENNTNTIENGKDHKRE
jgi:hypothetical protein